MLARISILCAMLRLLGTALRWSLLPILFILAEAMAAGLWRALGGRGMDPESGLRPLALWAGTGLGFRILFHWALRRLGRDDPLDFIDTLEHELTHALAGYLTLCPPVSLSASLKAGGEVELKGSNPIAVLAPYFLPLWCFLILLLGLAVDAGMQTAWSRLQFFMLGWFAYRLSREYRWRQTDLHVYGFLFSTLCVAILLMVSLGAILYGRGVLSWDWLTEAAFRTGRTLPAAWEWFRLRTGRG